MTVIDKDTTLIIENLGRGRAEEFTFPFTDVNDDPVDPASVTVEVQEPDGTTTTYTYPDDGEVVKADVGIYTFTQLFDAPWSWFIRCTGTGDGATSQVVEVRVSPDVFY
jgi:hypothetical protein